MDCREVLSLADDHVFGLLDSDIEGQVALHVESCADCALAVEKARRRRELLNAWRVDTPEGAAWRVLGRIRALSRRARTPLFIKVSAIAAVVLAAVALPLVYLSEQPAVMSFQPIILSRSGILHRTVTRELYIAPGQLQNAYVLIRLRAMGAEARISAWYSLNHGGFQQLRDAGVGNCFTTVLTEKDGLTAGFNVLTIENSQSAPVEFEIILVTGSTD